MASLLFTIGVTLVNALAFSGTNFLFRRFTKWNKDQMKRLDFINKRLCEKIELRVCINNVDEAMLKYYRVFSKQIKPLPSEPQLSDFYHPSVSQKNGELLLVAVGIGIGTYAIYKYLK